jgi:mannose-6-phosphate isomerase-like protein (cupin superfamily)
MTVERNESVVLSIVVISYNHEKFILETLRSVFCQFVDFQVEVIIADDHSGDNTQRVISDFLLNCNTNWNVYFFQHEKNLGMQNNFRFVLEKCNGKYISVCEGDDYWTDSYKVKKLHIYPGSKISLQYHNKRSEHWVVTSGKAMVTHGNKSFVLEKEQSTYIPTGTIHRLENVGKEPLEIIEVQIGAYLEEDDIVRLEDKYGRCNQ